MNKNFQQQKTRQLAKKDRSDKQSMDRKIKKLCDKINKKKQYYTTSSCAGRVVLIKAQEKKGPGLFLFRSHNKITLSELKKQLNKIKSKEKGFVYFKQEACILHVACTDLQAAQNLLNKAKFAGWKKSGFIASNKRIVCELMSSEKIELPIINKGEILVSDDYLKLLVQEANKKLEKSWKKIKKLKILL